MAPNVYNVYKSHTFHMLGYSWSCINMINSHTVKPVLRQHCHERLPVLKDHHFLAECHTFQGKWTFDHTWRTESRLWWKNSRIFGRIFSTIILTLYVECVIRNYVSMQSQKNIHSQSKWTCPQRPPVLRDQNFTVQGSLSTQDCTV